MRTSLLLISFLSMVGCGGVVRLPDGEPASDSGGDGLPDSDLPDGPMACGRTSDRAEISLLGGGHDDGCMVHTEGDGPGTHDFIARVASTTASSIALDTCPPFADCIPTMTRLTVQSPGLDLRVIRVNAYVKVHAEFHSGWGCTSSVQVDSIADWGGARNPVDGDRFLLAATDGGQLTTLPFVVEKVHTGCFTPPGRSCAGSPDDVDWFSYRFSGSIATTVPMGGTQQFVARGQTLTARNLRSFFEGVCDAYSDYAWWAIAP